MVWPAAWLVLPSGTCHSACHLLVVVPFRAKWTFPACVFAENLRRAIFLAKESVSAVGFFARTPRVRASRGPTYRSTRFPRALFSKLCTSPFFGSRNSFLRSEFEYDRRNHRPPCKSHGHIYGITTSPRALLSKTCTQPYFGSMSSFMRSEFVYGHRKYTSLCKSHGQIYRSTTSPCASFPKTRRIPFFGSMNSFPWSELMYGHRKYKFLCKSLGQIYRSPTSPRAF